MNYYNEIKEKLLLDEAYSKIKDYSKERHRVITYFEIGKLLNEAGSKYGENIIEEYSIKLVIEIGKKFNKRTLFRMRQFYNIFKDENMSTLSTQLTWSHYTELLPIKDKKELLYYHNICINHNINVRELRKKIKSKEYNRLPEKGRMFLTNQENTTLINCIKNPINIICNKKYYNISEKMLKNIILENIELFMKELGYSFSFIASEYKIKIGDTYNYIDLLFFNYKYNCFVVIELKVTELKKEHIGQIQVYMNYIDDNLKNINQDKTIGIIICREDNEYIIKYCSDERIIARKYELE